VCVACPCADAAKFSSSFDKKILFGKLPCKEKKKTLAMMASVFFFFSQESSPNKKFLSKDGEKLSASAQGQATHRENLRALQLLWRDNYNIKRSQLMWCALYISPADCNILN
jgi:hypothetical protein